MQNRLNRISFFILVGLVTGVALSDPPSLPDLSSFPSALGVNIHFVDPQPGELEQIYAGGFRWVRMDFGWGGIERQKGEYDFSAYDRLVAALDQHHLRAYFILDYSNHNYDKDLSPNSDDGRAAFAKWAVASVRHFKSHGIIWEMYNEPNLGFWRPMPNAEDYTKLALVVGKAIRESEPGEIYIGPATSTIDLPFLETCFKAGCLEYWSAVSVHPYRQSNPETVGEEYRKLRLLIAQYAPKGRQIPIISGEWGYSSAWKNFDENRQGNYLPRELLANVASEIPLSIWYDWHDDGTDPSEAEHHFGTVHHDVSKKPGERYAAKRAYENARSLGENLQGYRFNKRLAIGNENDYFLLFEGEKDATAIAYWTTEESRDFYAPTPFVNKFQLANTPKYMFFNGPGVLRNAMHVAAAWSRLPQEVTASAPATLHIESTIGNPIKDGVLQVIYGPNKEVTIDVGQSASIITDAVITRDPNQEPIVARIKVISPLHIDQAAFQQRIHVVVSNPLYTDLFPQRDATRYVSIQNPSGQATRGAMALVVRENETGPSVPLELKQGETTKVVALPIPAGLDTRDLAGIRLTGDDGQILLNTRYTRQSALADFAEHGATSWKVIADGDPKIGSELSLTDGMPPEGPPIPGAKSLKITYRFDKGWKFLRLAPSPALDAGIKDQPRALGLWVYGDGQGNSVRMRFTDFSGQTFQPDAGRISWNGWRYITLPLKGEIAHWGGHGNGVLSHPISLDTLFLLDGSRQKATRGTIYVSMPTLIYDR